MTLPKIDGYSYYISNDSDDDLADVDSSDEEALDEVDVFLYGTPKQKRKALKNLTGDEASSSDDDFEKIMQAELDKKFKAIENSWKYSDDSKNDPTTSISTVKSETSSDSKPKYYNDIYFDSDDEDKSKRLRLTDDELFYDPKADDEDQKWADKQRKRVLKRKKTSQKKETSQPASGSDAVLTCPACMTTLCMDCQRHSIYEHQYRAMFVMNCNVVFDEVLHYKEKQKKHFKRHKKRSLGTTQNFASNLTSGVGEASDTKYHPVKCSVCSTEVAVYDSDEVYHFFNVLSGNA